MIIYEVYYSGEDGNYVEWHGNMYSVEEAKKRLLVEYGEDPGIGVRRHVLINKKDILNFLNNRFNRDNG